MYDARELDLRKADMFSLGASVYEICLGRQLPLGGGGGGDSGGGGGMPSAARPSEWQILRCSS